MSENSTYARNGSQRKQMHYSPNLLSTINNAIDNCKLATIEYDSNEKGITVRQIEPMAIVYKDRKRCLIAWCRLRDDFRSFRLDRLNLIKLHSEEFSRREDFSVADYQDDPNTVGHEHYDDEDQ